MTPRQSSEKIPEIGICRRLVAGRSCFARISKSLPKSLGIATGMINRDHADFVGFDCKISPIFESRHSGFAYDLGFLGEKFGVLHNLLEQALKFRIKLATEPRSLFLVPFQSLKVVQIGGRLKPHAPHSHPKRLRASLRTCSHGIPTLGFLRNSLARRSSSASCSGVKLSSKSPNSRQTNSASLPF